MKIDCPYCFERQDYIGDPMSDGDKKSQSCKICEREFTVIASVTVSYEAVEKDQDDETFTMQD